MENSSKDHHRRSKKEFKVSEHLGSHEFHDQTYFLVSEINVSLFTSRAIIFNMKSKTFILPNITSVKLDVCLSCIVDDMRRETN